MEQKIITEELREWASVEVPYKYGHQLTAIADRIDVEYQKALDEWKAKHGQTWLKGYAECHAELLEGNETLASDLESCGWVRLPVKGEAPSEQLAEWIEGRGLVDGPLDADGELWHRGDMSDTNWGVIEGISFSNGEWWIRGHDVTAPWIAANSARHYHAQTVEDLLREFVSEFNRDDTELCDDEIIERFAAKLRLADDGEE